MLSGFVGLTATEGSTSAFWHSTLESNASPAPPQPGGNGLAPLAVDIGPSDNVHALSGLNYP